MVLPHNLFTHRWHVASENFNGINLPHPAQILYQVNNHMDHFKNFKNKGSKSKLQFRVFLFLFTQHRLVAISHHQTCAWLNVFILVAAYKLPDVLNSSGRSDWNWVSRMVEHQVQGSPEWMDYILFSSSHYIKKLLCMCWWCSLKSIDFCVNLVHLWVEILDQVCTFVVGAKARDTQKEFSFKKQSNKSSIRWVELYSTCKWRSSKPGNVIQFLISPLVYCHCKPYHHCLLAEGYLHYLNELWARVSKNSHLFGPRQYCC